jgi:hypothetical protein
MSSKEYIHQSIRLQSRELGNALGKHITVGQCCFKAESVEQRYDRSLNYVGTPVMKGRGAKEKNRCAIFIPTHFQMHHCFLDAVTSPPSNLAVILFNILKCLTYLHICVQKIRRRTLCAETKRTVFFP